MDELRKQLRGMVDKFTDELLTLADSHAHKMTVIRLREARAAARARGGRFGKVPYGEDPRYPQEKEGVKFMVKMHKEGHPYRTICESLERQGFDLRSKGNWNPGTVKRILDRQAKA